MTEEVLPDHTRLSASGAERWMECSASIGIAEFLELEGEESSYAAEGTAAHELLEECMNEDADAYEYIGETFYDHEVAEEMSAAVQMCLDYCRGLIKRTANQEQIVMVETRVDNKDLHPDFGGTADFILITETDLYVVDYKHGVGVAKDAEKNPQLMYYALGAFHQLPLEHRKQIQEIHVVIVQPRAFHPKGPIREWPIERDDLLRWGKLDLFPAMLAVDGDDTVLKPGPHCQFCPAKIGCPTMQLMFKAASKADPDEAKTLTDKELSDEYAMIGRVQSYIKAVQSEAYNRANKGRKITSGKLVEGRVDRVFTEEGKKKLKKKFGDDAYQDRKLRTPADIEKNEVGGRKFVAEYAHKPKKGKLSFVDIDKPGKAIEVKSAAQKFRQAKEKPGA